MKSVSYGEILWDVFGTDEHIGGAPFNLAAHLAKMGTESFLISRIGDDDRGRRARDAAYSLGVDTSLIQTDPKHPTGRVDVILHGEGIPSYTIHTDCAYDYINAQDIVFDELGELDLFCFGSLAQRNTVSCESLYAILKKVNAGEVFYDVNLRQNFFSREIVERSFDFASIVKLNDEEAAVIAKLVFGRELSEDDLVKAMLEEYAIPVVCITHGKDGCVVYESCVKASVPSVAVKVVDTVGAGDSFSAGFLYKYLAGSSVYDAAVFANTIGGFVASQNGAIPEYSAEILNLLNQ